MTRIGWMLLAASLIACGHKSESSSAGSGAATGAPRFTKQPQPKVSPVCQKARGVLGYGAECIETALPELTSPAGKIVRVVRKGDPTADWLYALIKPDGAIAIGDGGSNGSFLRALAKGIDLTTQPPELLAKLAATFDYEVAVVRCLPGANDALPDKDGKPVPCAAPSVATKDGKQVVSFIVEKFPHPRLLNRTDHWISSANYEVRPHELSSIGGVGLVSLPVTAPLPKDAPPVPTMTTPPSWVAAPEPAPADLNAALCAAAQEKISGLAGRACKAYAYPSLTLPTGALFYLANDAGQRNVLALRKPDGTIAVGYALETDANPLLPILATYDPKVVPPEKLLAAYLFLAAEPARILCLPGSGDTIPDHPCTPPSAEKQHDKVVLEAIVEEIPLPDGHGRVSDPAVRSYSVELSFTGGSLGGGMRLIDMRDN